MWIMSFFAFFLQTVPYFGLPLAVYALYYIWKPQTGYPGATTFWRKAQVAAKYLFILLGIDAALILIWAFR